MSYVYMLTAVNDGIGHSVFVTGLNVSYVYADHSE